MCVRVRLCNAQALNCLVRLLKGVFSPGSPASARDITLGLGWTGEFMSNKSDEAEGPSSTVTMHHEREMHCEDAL